jgi:hypothetical protein
MPSMPTEGEQSLAKRLAHTDKSVRDDAFKMVGNWLESQLSSISIKEEDVLENQQHLEMLKFWKALFYCVWMSDKPAVQMELVGKVAHLLRIFYQPLTLSSNINNKKGKVQSEKSVWDHRAENGIIFFRCFFETLIREWAGLDRYRLDKFLSLIRKMLHEGFLFCSDRVNESGSSIKTTRDNEMTNWETKASAGVASVLSDVMSSSSTPNGIRLHIVDIFMDELLFALGSRLNTQLFLSIASPMANVLRNTDSLVLFERVSTAVWSGSAPGGTLVGSGSGLLWRLLDKESLETSSEIKEKIQLENSINAATVARFLFSIGADTTTRSSQRSGVYSLHKEWSIVAIKLGHAKNESETYPDGNLSKFSTISLSKKVKDHESLRVGQKRGRSTEQKEINKIEIEKNDAVINDEEEEEDEDELVKENDDDDNEEQQIKKKRKTRTKQKNRSIKVEEKEHKVGKPRGLKSAAKSKKKFNRRLRK